VQMTCSQLDADSVLTWRFIGLHGVVRCVCCQPATALQDMLRVVLVVGTAGIGFDLLDCLGTSSLAL
jgi:hypothetical protein